MAVVVPEAKLLVVVLPCVLLTDQAKLKPAVVSAELGSVAEPVRLMGVPSGLLAGAVLMLAVGATLATVTWRVLESERVVLSVAVTVTVEGVPGLSGVVW